MTYENRGVGAGAPKEWRCKGGSLAFLGLGLALVAPLAGCQDSSYEFAPASGVVTLDGRPLPDAQVTFLHVPTGDTIVAGPDATAKTDSEGKFTLSTAEGQQGAVIGRHEVRISTRRYERVGEGVEDFKLAAKEIVPAKYRRSGELTAEVPAGGKEDFKFELSSR